MRIDLLHGIVDEWLPECSTHRLYVSREAFISYLEKRDDRYAAWNDTGATGDILTIDDSTRAGAAACLLARELGHEVVFFVNPFNIQYGKPYFFSVLDNMIDTRAMNSVHYFDTTFDLANPNDLCRFRVLAKERLRVLCEEKQEIMLLDISNALGTRLQDIPDHSAQITITELRMLYEAGVQIENHGWTHIEIGSLTEAEFEEHILLADNWINETVNYLPILYAVPFGETDLSSKRQDFLNRDYFLARKDLPSGFITGRCWNRRDITQELRKQS